MEFLKSLFDTSTERIKSPFIGSFIIAFIAYNWRAIFVLVLSNYPVETRIEHIETNYCEWSVLYIPLIISIIYVLLIPRINLLFDTALAGVDKEKKDRLSDKELEQLTRNEKIFEKQRILEDIKAGTSKIKDLNDENSSLKREMSLLTEDKKLDAERHNGIVKQLTLEKEDIISKSKSSMEILKNSVDENLEYLSKYKLKVMHMRDLVDVLVSDESEHENITLLFSAIAHNLSNSDIEIYINNINKDVRMVKSSITPYMKRVMEKVGIFKEDVENLGVLTKKAKSFREYLINTYVDYKKD